MAKKGQKEQPKGAKGSKSTVDKTFGMKNKNKSSKVQQYIKQVDAQSTNAIAAKRKAAEYERKQAEKKAAEQARMEARALFASTMAPQQIEVGVDPKSVVCAFFKQGLCNKGTKCKFSHDLSVERKGEKRDLYSDARDDKAADTMDKWDDEKLRIVTLSKHGNPQNTTDKICKHFIEAVENGKYGWFWICPNDGDNCKYRHSLPPGFKLKTKEEERRERQELLNAPKITLEEFIETERAKLPKEKTPITLETFTKWKEERNRQKRAAETEQAKNTKRVLTGREILTSGAFAGAGASTTNDENDEDDSWDLAALRRETEQEKDRLENERVEKNKLQKEEADAARFGNISISA